MDVHFNRVYDCRIENGEIAATGSLAGISRKSYCKYTLRVSVKRDGVIFCALTADVRENAVWLPRFGFDFKLKKENNAFTYFGMGPGECYADMRRNALYGMYESDSKKEYVNYIRPQEHGNHFGVKMLEIGKLKFVSDSGFEMRVSDYTDDMINRATHTNELVPNGSTNVRIDYKVSGIGSGSCGPLTIEKYRLSEKHIEFKFEIR